VPPASRFRLLSLANALREPGSQNNCQVYSEWGAIGVQAKPLILLDALNSTVQRKLIY
jgi:hypothetical protein